MVLLNPVCSGVVRRYSLLRPVCPFDRLRAGSYGHTTNGSFPLPPGNGQSRQEIPLAEGHKVRIMIFRTEEVRL